MAVKKAPVKGKSAPASAPSSKARKTKPAAPKASKASARVAAPSPSKTIAKVSAPASKASAAKAPVKQVVKPVATAGNKKEAPKATSVTKATPNASKSPTKTLPTPQPALVTSKKVVPQAQDAKPVKQPSGLKKADFDYFRNLLLEKRREILGDVGSMESEAFKAGSNLSNMPIHMADVGTDNFEQEFTLGLIESERQILREIQEALGRIDDGSFGVCLGTGQPIPRVRLEAVPWAKYTIEYSRMLEQGLIRKESDSSRDDDGGSDDDEE